MKHLSKIRDAEQTSEKLHSHRDFAKHHELVRVSSNFNLAKELSYLFVNIENRLARGNAGRASKSILSIYREWRRAHRCKRWKPFEGGEDRKFWKIGFAHYHSAPSG